jgi:hypothetical protein
LNVLKASSVLVLAVTVATLVPASFAIFGLGPPLEVRKSALGFYSNADSSIKDALGDAKPVLQQSPTGIVPQVHDYHDIVAASVKRLDGPSFLLTTRLAGNPNQNEKYETMYAWHIITRSSAAGQDQVYTVAFSNFPKGFTNVTEPGWYYAVFNNTAGSVILPFTQIWDMPEDGVEFPVEDFYIGSPREFHYWVSSYVRVNNTSFGDMPDYLMDDAP